MSGPTLGPCCIPHISKARRSGYWPGVLILGWSFIVYMSFHSDQLLARPCDPGPLPLQPVPFCFPLLTMLSFNDADVTKSKRYSLVTATKMASPNLYPHALSYFSSRHILHFDITWHIYYFIIMPYLQELKHKLHSRKHFVLLSTVSSDI